VEVLRVSPGGAGLDLPAVLRELGRRRISSLLVEGGGRVLGSFIEGGFADEFFFFYAPKILADPGGIRMLRGLPRLRIADCVQAYQISARRLGEDFFVKGKFRKQLY
jgi:diaminohydroxyphosphoribosylaminopyrimidine deaminase/5-amino-6-(5-phosphoribosylamino)uracil reductase